MGMARGRPWNFTALEGSTGGGVDLAECCRMRLGGCGGAGGSSTAERSIRAQCGLEGSLRSKLRYSWRLEADSLGWIRKELRTFTL